MTENIYQSIALSVTSDTIFTEYLLYSPDKFSLVAGHFSFLSLEFTQENEGVFSPHPLEGM